MSWSKVILIITALVTMAIAIYFLLKLLGIDLAEIFIPTKPYQELTSMAALACAVDVVGTQNINVATCNEKFYRWGEANVFETITGYAVWTKNVITGMVSLNSPKDWDVYCGVNPAVQFASPTKVGFVCESRRGDKSFVECWKEAEIWKCKVIDFYLRQKFSEGEARSLLEKAIHADLWGIIKAGAKTAGEVIEEVAKGDLPKIFAWAGKMWVGEWGEPRYLVYYETFPAYMEGIWTVDVGDVAISTIALGGVMNTAFSMYAPIKAGASAIKQGIKPILHLQVRTGLSAMKKAFVSEMWEQLSKMSVVKIVTEHLARGKALSDMAIKEAGEKSTGKAISGEITETFFKRDLPVFPAARGASRYFGLGDAAGDAFIGNLYSKLASLSFMTRGKQEITEDLVKEILEKSIPESLSEESREIFLKEFAKGLGTENIDEAAEKLTKVINEEELIPKIFDLSILSPETKEVLKEGLEATVRKIISEGEDMRKAFVMAAVRGQERKELLEIFVKKGIIPEKFRKIYEDEVEKIATIALQDAIGRYKLAQLTEKAVGEVGLATAIRNSFDKAFEEANMMARDLGYNKFKDMLFDGMRVRIESRLGFGPENWKKRMFWLTIAAAYLYTAADTTTEKFETCGANSLCLHTQHFFAQNNYNISLATQGSMVVTEYESGNIVSWLGVSDPKKVRGFVVSPCRADLIIEKGKARCNNYIGYDTIAYTFPFKLVSSDGTTRIEFGYTSTEYGVEDKCPDLPNLDRTNFWKELYERKCIDYSTTFKIKNYKNYCNAYASLSDCVRGHFLQQMEAVLKGKKKLEFQYEDKIFPHSEYTESKEEEKKQILLSAPYRILNVKSNVLTGEDEIISSCEPPSDIPIIGWENWWEGEERDAVIIKADRSAMKAYYERDPEKNTNYCIPYEAKVDGFYVVTQIAQFIPWEVVLAGIGSIVPGVGTAAGYAAGMALNFAVGAAGSIANHNANIAMAWPNNQFS